MKKTLCYMMLVVFGIGLCGCAEKTENLQNNTDVEAEIINSQEESGKMQINETKDGVVVGELLDCIEFLGKTDKELEIPESVIADNAVSLKTYLDGTLLGKKDYAVLYFDENDRSAYRMWIHIGESTFTECQNALNERFGAETGSGEEPYAEVNGGAVLWSTYESDSLKIRLSTASQRAYAEIDVTMK